MNQMSQILEEKGHDVLQIEAEASVFEAVKRMVAATLHRCCAEGSEITGSSPSGITSPRDGQGRHADEGTWVPRNHVLTADRCHRRRRQSMNAWQVMTDRRIRHLPVVDEKGEVVGMVSMGDVVKFKSKQQTSRSSFCTSTWARAKPRRL